MRASIAAVTTAPEPRRVRSRGSTAVPRTAPAPTATRSPPYPFGPRPMGPRATAGSSAQRPLANTMNSAERARTLLNAGALPAPMKVEEQRTVGAELGADAVFTKGEFKAFIAYITGLRPREVGVASPA